MSAFPIRATLAGSPNKATSQAWFLAMFDALAQRLAAGTAGAGTATSAELAAARASLLVGDGGMKNRVINAGCYVQQRAAPTLTASYQYGAADRHMAAAVGGTGISGTVNVAVNTAMASGLAFGAIAASWTSGTFCYQHRIEYRNVLDMKSKTVTLSGKVFQDTGGSRNFVASLYKANAQDNFSGLTLIASSTAFAVASGVTTAFTFTTTLNSTDADNGIVILIQDAASNTVVSKNYMVGDLQLEPGAAATALEIRSVAADRALCERYFQLLPNIQFVSYSTAGNPIGQTYALKNTMRATPSVSGTAGYNNASGLTAVASPDGIYLYANVTATGPASWQYTNVACSAEL